MISVWEALFEANKAPRNAADHREAAMTRLFPCGALCHILAIIR